jgi:hypothetical protein
MALLQSIPIQQQNLTHTHITKCQWSLYQNIYTLTEDNTIHIHSFKNIEYSQCDCSHSTNSTIQECDYIYDFSFIYPCPGRECVITAVRSQPIHIWENGQILQSLYCKSSIDEHMHPIAVCADGVNKEVYGCYHHTIVKFDIEYNHLQVPIH